MYVLGTRPRPIVVFRGDAQVGELNAAFQRKDLASLIRWAIYSNIIRMEVCGEMR